VGVGGGREREEGEGGEGGGGEGGEGRTCVRCTRRLTCPLLPNVNKHEELPYLPKQR
jgi:hypothetical protein